LSNVQIDINGRQYGVGCEDGQEEHIGRLARHFDNHVRNLVQSVGQIGEQRLFLMAALLLADETHDLKLKLDSTEAELARLRDGRNGSEQLRQLQEIEGQAEQNLADAKNIEKEAALAIENAANYFSDAASRVGTLATKLAEA
jgi:cell division protein ZapA